jgi:hypothetical protein
MVKGRQHPRPSVYITLGDLYLAYRKAKSEAFYENTHFHALAFADYEMQLDKHLRSLLVQLRDPAGNWAANPEFLGHFTYAPKSLGVDHPAEQDPVFFRSLDPMKEWERKWGASNARANAEFRLIIIPSINFHIVSALWIVKIGWKYESRLDSNLSFGNRLRLRKSKDVADLFEPSKTLNADCVGLFAPYFSAYRTWRERGLNAMRSGLEGGKRIFAVTMDIKRFYHRVSPQFLVHPAFLEIMNLKLDANELHFTTLMIGAINTWYAQTPDAAKRPQGALPVGLSASKVMANILLAEFDRDVVKSLKPHYYGRYVDDIFLVFSPDRELDSGVATIRWLAEKIPRTVSFEEQIAGERTCLRINLPYATDSELIFGGSKQKIFDLAAPHGLDLIAQIEDQIRRQSSEHRLLPILPDTEERMASRALLAQPNASLEADALRKADVISVRRLGLSLLLRDAECYARDLPPSYWRDIRTQFFGLIDRHLLTPVGVFEFFAYLHRAIGLFVACGDWACVLRITQRLAEILDLLERTSTAGTTQRVEFKACKTFLATALLQVTLQATTVSRFRWSRRILEVVRSIHRIAEFLKIPRTIGACQGLSLKILYADWGRRPYREEWLAGGNRRMDNPKVPMGVSVQRVLRLRGIRTFRKSAALGVPYWPALAFPTRPMSLTEITLAAPQLLQKPIALRDALFSLRGALAKESEDVIHVSQVDENRKVCEFRVNGDPCDDVHVAIPSILTSETQWEAALSGKPDLSVKRYQRIRHLINQILRAPIRASYILLPECSIPERWALGIAYSLARYKISMIAGLEYRLESGRIRNDALLSLATDWPWHSSSILFKQPKTAPAHDERAQLYKKAKRKLYRPSAEERYLPVYVHAGFCFGVMICSDLTNISLRRRFQGEIDALFALEWNKDTETFSTLVESSAQDLHAFVVQVNNREFGDSRARIPASKSYQRDIVRVKGGLHDYFVMATLSYKQLRNFQRGSKKGKNARFKPVPIGFEMSVLRRNGL